MSLSRGGVSIVQPEPLRTIAFAATDTLLREARDLGINLSQACEVGLSAAVVGERRRRWLQQNQDALDDYNSYVERNGLPLAAYRQF